MLGLWAEMLQLAWIMSPLIQEITDRPDLWALCVHLSALQQSVKRYSMEQAQLAVYSLASRMQAEMSADLLSTIRIVPIPRGGLLVAGRLAYALNLSYEQFFDDGVSPICVVDDCALTGKRFKQVLGRFEDRDIWFCHLASTSQLRRTILNEEPWVKGCIVADDLSIQNQAVAEQIPGEDRYLNVSVEPVIFPWTEPGLPVTVPFSDKVEDGWRLMAPHLVLGNWSLLKLPPKKTEIADIQSSSQIVWRLIDKTILLYEGSSRKLFELTGVAADLWKSCAGYQSREIALQWSRSGQKGVTVEKANLLIDELLAKKLLVQI